jgi:single stranded DNA-binding protein
MSGDTQITIAGNLVDDPELRFTPAGQPVARFRVASVPRYLDKSTNEWKDGDGLFLTVNVWRQQAENVAESLHRGTRVIVPASCGSGPTRPRKARSGPFSRSRRTRSRRRSSSPRRR